MYTTQASMVHDLLCAYDLDKMCTVIEPISATADELTLFHSANYISYLKQQNKSYAKNGNNCSSLSEDSFDLDETVDDEQLEYGIGKSIFMWGFLYY